MGEVRWEEFQSITFWYSFFLTVDSRKFLSVRSIEGESLYILEEGKTLFAKLSRTTKYSLYLSAISEKYRLDNTCYLELYSSHQYTDIARLREEDASTFWYARDDFS